MKEELIDLKEQSKYKKKTLQTYEFLLRQSKKPKEPDPNIVKAIKDILTEEPHISAEEVEQKVRYNVALKSAQKHEINKIAEQELLKYEEMKKLLLENKNDTVISQKNNIIQLEQQFV